MIVDMDLQNKAILHSPLKHKLMPKSNNAFAEIGCGYCLHEKYCTIKVPGVNMAKKGCTDFQHWETAPKLVEDIIKLVDKKNREKS